MRTGTPFPRRPRRACGFTLVELMVGVVIVGLLVALAIPAFRKVRNTSQAKIVTNDLRVFAGAFQSYNSQNARWPAETAAGVYPTEMAALLNRTNWMRVTPFGGSYNWDNNQTHGGRRYAAAIAISATAARPITAPQAVWQLVDKQVDDGNLSTGNFFLGASSRPVFIIQR